MNRRIGRMVLAGVCWSAVVSVAAAQTGRTPDDDAAHPSHRLLDNGVGDLAGAEELLALRLHHTQDVQEIQDLVKSLLDSGEYRKMLQDQIKDLKPDDIQALKETIRKNPQLLDQANLHDLLKDAEQFKKDGDLNHLPPETKDRVAKLAQDLIKKQKSADPGFDNPMTGDPKNPGTPEPPKAVNLPRPSAPPELVPRPSRDESQPNWVTHHLVQGVTGLIKDIDRTPEGEALRTAALRELARIESGSSASSSGLADFLKNVLSSDQASWLAHAGKASPPAGLDGWDLGGAASAAPSVGGSSGGGLMDGVVWVAALGLLIAAGWMAVVVARRQAASRMQARPWSPGPWPVRPSQVSTRQDLIRAFEHLAYLLLGPTARSLNHLDVAGRLRQNDGRHARAADRLAHLYEQARYAPPDEVMPLNELTAARGDLAALAGAAA